jgi:hypothetical protein
MNVPALTRSLYLYVAAFVGLMLLTVGGVRLVDLGLKVALFPAAEQEMRGYSMPPPMTMAPERHGGPREADMTPEEREAWRAWLEENRRQQEEMARVDPVASRRQREASRSLALILIGLPLYLYHWRTIRREQRLRREPPPAVLA